MSEPYQLPPGTRDPLTPRDVAEVFRVNPVTVSRWADERWIDSFRTPGGHRRFPLADVQSALREGFQPRTSPDTPRSS